MTIRTKKGPKEQLQKAEFYIDKPDAFKGTWKKKFKNDQPLHVELGCGKGSFIANLASKYRDINYIAVDMIEAMLGLSKRNIEKSYNFTNPENLFLIRANVEQISNVFDSSDLVERIYINFCNPWPKKKHNKKRLTHTRQLNLYKSFLIPEGEVYFKTDSDELFEASLEYFKESGFEIITKTYDLHKENVFEENIETEHEKMFSEEGIKIKALIAKFNIR